MHRIAIAIAAALWLSSAAASIAAERAIDKEVIVPASNARLSLSGSPTSTAARPRV